MRNAIFNREVEWQTRMRLDVVTTDLNEQRRIRKLEQEKRRCTFVSQRMSIEKGKKMFFHPSPSIGQRKKPFKGGHVFSDLNPFPHFGHN